MDREQLDAYLRDHLLPTIEKHGHAVQGVFATEPGPVGFAYTVGLTTRGWPELILLCPDLNLGTQVVNGVVAWCDRHGVVPADGTELDLFDTGYLTRLRACRPDTDDAPCSMAMVLYDDITTLQVVLPDDEHRYPGEPGFNMEWETLLP